MHTETPPSQNKFCSSLLKKKNPFLLFSFPSTLYISIYFRDFSGVLANAKRVFPMSSSNKNLQASTFKDLEKEEREREGEERGGGRGPRCQRKGIFTLRQQLKWVITALKLQTDWALLTCHCEGSHKGNSIYREGCTLTLVNWSGGSECCDRG